VIQTDLLDWKWGARASDVIVAAKKAASDNATVLKLQQHIRLEHWMKDSYIYIQKATWFGES
jgi:hypothetical protein